MAFTSLQALVAAAAALPVTGIKKSAAFRPRIVNPADLPFLFTRLPGSTRAISTLTYGQGLRMATLEIVVLVQMLNLDTQAANDALTVVLLDNLAATLEVNASSLGMDSYTLSTDEDTIGDGMQPVQAIIASLEVSG
jgi:hypothetical protein